MLRFKEYLVEAAQGGKNLHLEHLEDEVLNGGVAGTRGAINFLQSLRDMLAGNASSGVDITVKWDGAPAVFAGTNPENGKFFVGTKGIFRMGGAKKVNYTHDDIDRNHSGGLADKLHVSLDELSKVGIKGVLQGDIMYTKDDLQTKTIDDETYIIFQPNTIVYAVPQNSQLASKIKSSKMGIIWHTTYSGDTMEGMKASFGVSDSAFKETKSVWQADASFTDTSGSSTMTKKETEEVTKILSQAGKKFHELKKEALETIAKEERIGILVKTYANKMIRQGQRITNPRKHAAGTIASAYDRLKVDVDRVKTDKMKKVKQEEMDRYMKFLRSNSSQLVKIFEMQNLLIDAKMLIVRKLEKIKGMTKTFIKTDSGYEVTTPEGFVAIDTMKGNAVKLVDRLTFSLNNFTVAKSWDK